MRINQVDLNAIIYFRIKAWRKKQAEISTVIFLLLITIITIVEGKNIQIKSVWMEDYPRQRWTCACQNGPV